MTVLYIRFDCRNQEINLKWQLVSVWVDWRGLIECEINKVSHSALQRPLNDLYEDDHQGFDGLMLGMKVLSAFGLGSTSFYSLSLSQCLCFFQSVCLPSSFCFSIPYHPIHLVHNSISFFLSFSIHHPYVFLSVLRSLTVSHFVSYLLSYSWHWFSLSDNLPIIIILFGN